MPEKVTISHRGARYEIGRGKRCYGIWVTGAPESDPVDRWPETPDGWTQAWARFVALESPGTITEVKPEGFKFRGFRRGGASDAPAGEGAADTPRAKAPVNAARAAAGLLAAGVIIGIVGLFPDYTGSSLASDATQLVPHLLYLAGWAAGAGLVITGLRRAAAGETGRVRAGALLAAGVGATTLGMLGADLGEVIAGQGSSGAGLWLAIAGWVLCTAGAIAGLGVKARKDAPEPVSAPADPASGQDPGYAQGPGFAQNPGYGQNPGYQPRKHLGPVALLVLGGLGTAASFAPSWDAYTLQSPVGSETVTLGNAFSFPAPVVTANVLVMIAVVAVAIAAALWRPMRHGAVLLAGAIIPMVAQAISALIQVSQPASPAMFGISPAQASAAGLSIGASPTPIFWVYCVFVIALAISCAWLVTEPAVPVMPNPAPSPWAGPMTPAGEENRIQPSGTENVTEKVAENTAAENAAVPEENRESATED